MAKKEDRVSVLAAGGIGMNDTKKEYLAYFERVRAAGARILAYKCPNCKESIDTVAPNTKRERWDTMTTCPHCHHLHWKVVKCNSVVATDVKKI